MIIQNHELITFNSHDFIYFYYILHYKIKLQDSSNFYLFMGDNERHAWQLKRINSETGPVGSVMASAIANLESVPGQTEVLWSVNGAGGTIIKFGIITYTSYIISNTLFRRMGSRNLLQIQHPSQTWPRPHPTETLGSRSSNRGYWRHHWCGRAEP